MKLHALEIGRLETNTQHINGIDSAIVMPIPAWLVEHPAGLVLFDAGLHQDLVHDVTRIGEAAKSYRPDFKADEVLTAQLARLGVRPSDVTHLILSHLHFDHCGGAVEVPDAKLVVQATEWKAGHRQKLLDLGVYFLADYDHGHDVQQLHGTHDLFGDGQIVCFPTPGHTAGHQSLRIQLDSGPVVLTADCVYWESMLTNSAVPSFGYDTTLQLESMKELVRLRDNEGCRLLFGHDEAQLRSLPSVLT